MLEQNVMDDISKKLTNDQKEFSKKFHPFSEIFTAQNDENIGEYKNQVELIAQNVNSEDSNFNKVISIDTELTYTEASKEDSEVFELKDEYKQNTDCINSVRYNSTKPEIEINDCNNIDHKMYKYEINCLKTELDCCKRLLNNYEILLHEKTDIINILRKLTVDSCDRQVSYIDNNTKHHIKEEQKTTNSQLECFDSKQCDDISHEQTTVSADIHKVSHEQHNEQFGRKKTAGFIQCNNLITANDKNMHGVKQSVHQSGIDGIIDLLYSEQIEYSENKIQENSNEIQIIKNDKFDVTCKDQIDSISSGSDTNWTQTYTDDANLKNVEQEYDKKADYETYKNSENVFHNEDCKNAKDSLNQKIANPSELLNISDVEINNHVKILCNELFITKQQNKPLSDCILNNSICTTKDSYFDDISDSSSYYANDKIELIGTQNTANRATLTDLNQTHGTIANKPNSNIKKGRFYTKPKRVNKNLLINQKIPMCSTTKAEIKMFSDLYSSQNNILRHNAIQKDATIETDTEVNQNKALLYLNDETGAPNYNIDNLNNNYKNFVHGISDIIHGIEPKDVIEGHSESKQIENHIETTEIYKPLEAKKHLGESIENIEEKKLPSSCIVKSETSTYNAKYNEKITNLSIKFIINNFDINDFDFSHITAFEIKLCNDFDLNAYNESALQLNFNTQKEASLFKHVNNILQCPFVAYSYIKILVAYKNMYVDPWDLRRSLWAGDMSEKDISKKPACRIWFSALLIITLHKFGDFDKEGFFALRKVMIE